MAFPSRLYTNTILIMSSLMGNNMGNEMMWKYEKWNFTIMILSEIIGNGQELR